MYAETRHSDSAERLPERAAEIGGGTAINGSRIASLAALSESPSLRAWMAGSTPAFEMKFLLDEATVAAVEQYLAPGLSLDPHADPAQGHAYVINTTYCDTPALDVFHGRGRHERRKYRLRQYEGSSVVYLERKVKRGERVRKRRSPVAPEELARLGSREVDGSWSGDWFHRQLLRRQLSPVCCVRYVRKAYVGMAESGSVRLTFDRDIRGGALGDWLPRLSEPDVTLLDGFVVCEFKFRGALPALFKGAVQEFQLAPRGVSKFRHCLRAGGFAPGTEAPRA